MASPPPSITTSGDCVCICIAGMCVCNRCRDADAWFLSNSSSHHNHITSFTVFAPTVTMVGKFTYVPAAVYPLIAAVSAGCAASCYIIGRKIGYDPAVRYDTPNVTSNCNYDVGSRLGTEYAHRPSAIDA